MSISPEDVRLGYLFILGREPESETAIAAHSHQLNILRFRDGLLRSEEFRALYTPMSATTNHHPYESWNREAVAFIHIPKTGGTTLHNLLAACFAQDRTCPERFELLHLYSVAELSRYDFFSGHFDYLSSGLIPRHRVRRVSIFRDPCRRLISWYRYCKSHPMTGNFSSNPFVRLANALSVEEFFEHESVVSSPSSNSYTLYFGSWMADPTTIDALADQKIARDLLVRAKQNVLKLDAIGITERFTESVETIFTTLGFPIPLVITLAQVTDQLPDVNTHLSRVSPVTMTPRLARALEPLTKYDRELYDIATREFDRRRLTAQT